jgi:DNA (cytosine-5)-methyltransferase 1
MTQSTLPELKKEEIASKIKIPFPSPRRPQFSFIDLFAGIGGFRLAMQNLGGKCVFTSEIDINAQKTYLANFGEIPSGDITKINELDIPEHDVLCAGFPCQPFSIAGYRQGFEDIRGTLFFDIARIIKAKRPKAIFLENVKGLVNHNQGNTLKIILETLELTLGYKTHFQVLNTATHANIPQNRERLFIVGFDKHQVKQHQSFEFPAEIELTTTIHDFLENAKQEEIYYYKKAHPYYSELEKVMISEDTVYQWRRVYARENKSNLCPALTANMGTGGHNVPLIKDKFGIRKLTPRECFSLQGYPSEYILPDIVPNSKLYMQAGNSVTTNLIQRISTNLIKEL